MHFTTKLIQYQGAPCGAHPGALELNKPKARPQSLLEPSVKITGDLWSEGDVQIDGHLCGNINCAQLIVSKDAAVTGVIIAEEAVIRGKITGIIRATRVLLQDTARVKSEIIYQSLSIDEGATFEGVARPRLNPLEEEIAVSPMAELRQITARIEAGCANGSGPGCMPLAVDKAGPVSPPEPAGKSSDRVQPAAKRRRRKHRQLREYRMSLDDVHEPARTMSRGEALDRSLPAKRVRPERGSRPEMARNMLGPLCLC